MKLSSLVSAAPLLLGLACNNPGQGESQGSASDTGENITPWGDEASKACLADSRAQGSNSNAEVLTADGDPAAEEPTSVIIIEGNKLRLVLELTESPDGNYSPFRDGFDFALSAAEGEPNAGETRLSDELVEEVVPRSELANELRRDHFVVIDEGDHFVSVLFTLDPNTERYEIAGILGYCQEMTVLRVCSQGISYQGQIGTCPEINNPWTVDTVYLPRATE